jgi:hypothetical protein
MSISAEPPCAGWLYPKSRSNGSATVLCHFAGLVGVLHRSRCRRSQVINFLVERLGLLAKRP